MQNNEKGWLICQIKDNDFHTVFIFSLIVYSKIYLSSYSTVSSNYEINGSIKEQHIKNRILINRIVKNRTLKKPEFWKWKKNNKRTIKKKLTWNFGFLLLL